MTPNLNESQDDEDSNLINEKLVKNPLRISFLRDQFAQLQNDWNAQQKQVKTRDITQPRARAYGVAKEVAEEEKAPSKLAGLKQRVSRPPRQLQPFKPSVPSGNVDFRDDCNLRLSIPSKNPNTTPSPDPRALPLSQVKQSSVPSPSPRQNRPANQPQLAPKAPVKQQREIPASSPRPAATTPSHRHQSAPKNRPASPAKPAKPALPPQPSPKEAASAPNSTTADSGQHPPQLIAAENSVEESSAQKKKAQKWVPKPWVDPSVPTTPHKSPRPASEPPKSSSRGNRPESAQQGNLEKPPRKRWDLGPPQSAGEKQTECNSDHGKLPTPKSLSEEQAFAKERQEEVSKTSPRVPETSPSAKDSGKGCEQALNKVKKRNKKPAWTNPDGSERPSTPQEVFLPEVSDNESTPIKPNKGPTPSHTMGQGKANDQEALAAAVAVVVARVAELGMNKASGQRAKGTGSRDGKEDQTVEEGDKVGRTVQSKPSSVFETADCRPDDAMGIVEEPLQAVSISGSVEVSSIEVSSEWEPAPRNNKHAQHPSPPSMSNSTDGALIDSADRLAIEALTASVKSQGLLGEGSAGLPSTRDLAGPTASTPENGVNPAGDHPTTEKEHPWGAATTGRGRQRPDSEQLPVGVGQEGAIATATLAWTRGPGDPSGPPALMNQPPYTLPHDHKGSLFFMPPFGPGMTQPTAYLRPPGVGQNGDPSWPPYPMYPPTLARPDARNSNVGVSPSASSNPYVNNNVPIHHGYPFPPAPGEFNRTPPMGYGWQGSLSQKSRAQWNVHQQNPEVGISPQGLESLLPRGQWGSGPLPSPTYPHGSNTYPQVPNWPQYPQPPPYGAQPGGAQNPADAAMAAVNKASAGANPHERPGIYRSTSATETDLDRRAQAHMGANGNRPGMAQPPPYGPYGPQPMAGYPAYMAPNMAGYGAYFMQFPGYRPNGPWPPGPPPGGPPNGHPGPGGAAPIAANQAGPPGSVPPRRSDSGNSGRSLGEGSLGRVGEGSGSAGGNMGPREGEVAGWSAPRHEAQEGVLTGFKDIWSARQGKGPVEGPPGSRLKQPDPFAGMSLEEVLSSKTRMNTVKKDPVAA